MTKSHTNCALLLATLALCSIAQCSNSSNTDTSSTTAVNVESLTANSTRSARLMKRLAEPKALAVKRYRAAPSKLLSRVDHFPLPAGAGVAPPVMLHGRMPVPYRRFPPPPAPYMMKTHPAMVRRVQNGLAAVGGGVPAPPSHPSTRFAGGLFDGGKNLRHPSSKGPVPFNAGKVNPFRPPYGAAQPQPQPHPNALAQSTSTTQSVGVKQQKQQQQQQQQLQQQYQLQQQQQQLQQIHQQQQQQQQSQPFFLQHLHQQPYQGQQQHQQKQQQYLQQQHQQQQQHEYRGTHDYSFKASPPFNGKAIVRPLFDVPDPSKQNAPQTAQYPGQQTVQQYPIPEQSAHKQEGTSQASQQTSLLQYPTVYQSQEQSQLQSNSQTQLPTKSPVFHYETMRPHEEPVLHPHVKHEHGPPGLNGYAVYEGNDLTAELSAAQRAQAYQQAPTSDDELLQHHSSPETLAAREAQEYLKFMSTDEYFLPKREPDYRHLNVEQHQPVSYTHYQQQFDSSIPKQVHYSKSMSDNAGAASAASYLNQPIEVPQLFYHEDPTPTIVRGSYQTGNNLFVVNSDGNKAVKHVVPPPPTTIAPTYDATYGSGAGAGAAVRNRTPEPVRFEFTERDAIPASYTNSPLGKEQEQLRYKAAGVVVTTSTPHLPTAASSGTTVGTGTGTSGGNYNVVAADDPEDDDDVHTASSDRDNYGRVPIRQAAFSPSPAPVEQKDTEDYCERICANIQDEDEEIVCGSDGYMYTSEAQMECYASCLHIDVTIQSKGSCNAT